MVFLINNNKAHLACALLFLTTFIEAQYNLAPNPSFEQHTVLCANIIGGGGGANNWSEAGVTNYYKYTYSNTCATNSCCSLPASFGGRYQYAHTGNADILFYIISGFQPGNEDRSYPQTKLLDSLQANHSYYIEFYVNLGNFYIFASNNIGLLVGDTAIQAYKNHSVNATPQILQYGNPIILDTNWVKVSGVYKAHGGEQYITIGNFNDNAHTDTISSNMGAQQSGSGYFLDDVSVIPLDSMLLYADAGRDTTIKRGDSAWIGTRLCGLTNVVWYDSINGTKDTFAANVPGMWVKPTASNYYIITQTVNGFYSTDTVWVRVVQTVPVTITSYEASPTPPKEGLTGMGVLNSWVAVNEVNLSHYNVQRSLDGKVFETVGVVKAKGSGKYQYSDPLPANPLWGAGGQVLYYRLESVDKDGRSSYSKVVSVSLTTNNSPLITIYPNPTKGTVNIQLPPDDVSCRNVNIMDIYGRMITEKLNVTNKVSLEIKASPGIYFVNIVNCATGKSVVKKITLIN